MVEALVRHDGRVVSLSDLTQISELRRDPAQLVWLDVVLPDAAAVAHLGEEFGFHPLAVEDAVRRHERPKLDSYGDYLTIVFYAAGYRADADDAHIELQQLALFLGPNYLVTIQTAPITAIAECRSRWQRTAVEATPAALLHLVLDALVDEYFTLIDQVVEWVEELEDSIFTRFDPAAIQEIFGLKKDLLLLRRVIAPEREVLNLLLRRDEPLIAAESLYYLQDVYDHLVRVTDAVDTYRDLLSSALDSYLSLQANQLNQLIKTLTLSSIILMACSLIAGIYGMNFQHMPELSWQFGYPLALLLMAGIGTGLVTFFRSRRWW
jgi:magnesium transporter